MKCVKFSWYQLQAAPPHHQLPSCKVGAVHLHVQLFHLWAHIKVVEIGPGRFEKDLSCEKRTKIVAKLNFNPIPRRFLELLV